MDLFVAGLALGIIGTLLVLNIWQPSPALVTAVPPTEPTEDIGIHAKLTKPPGDLNTFVTTPQSLQNALRVKIDQSPWAAQAGINAYHQQQQAFVTMMACQASAPAPTCGEMCGGQQSFSMD